MHTSSAKDFSNSVQGNLGEDISHKYVKEKLRDGGQGSVEASLSPVSGLVSQCTAKEPNYPLAKLHPCPSTIPE